MFIGIVSGDVGALFCDRTFCKDFNNEIRILRQLLAVVRTVGDGLVV